MAKAKYTYTWADDSEHFKALDKPSPNQVALESEITNSEGYGFGAIVTALAHSVWDFSEKVCDIWFHGPLSASDLSILDAVVAAHKGDAINTNAEVRIEQADTYGRIRTTVEPPVGKELDRATHNFCDKCTWVDSSVAIENAPLEDSGDAKTFNIRDLAGELRDFIVYADHGHVLDEHIHYPNMSPVVKLGNKTLTAKKPWDSNEDEWDYELDHRGGVVTLREAKPGQSLTITCRYATDSWWKLAPAEGKQIIIQDAEAQFSADVEMRDCIVMRVMYRTEGGALVPLSSVSPGVEEKRWETISQMVQEAKGAYPVIPGIGGSARGLPCAVYGFPFAYLTSTDLPSSSFELWVGLCEHREFGGTSASATFYSRIDDV